MDILKPKCRLQITVAVMETIYAQTQLKTLHIRLRSIRASRNLTLAQVAKLSNGQISAIALGSYERGDRSVSAEKLILIAELYEIPIQELFESAQKVITEERVSIDIRKILLTMDPSARKVVEVIRNIARMRNDWNGEVISLRSQDILNLNLFSLIPIENLQTVIEQYRITRSK